MSAQPSEPFNPWLDASEQCAEANREHDVELRRADCGLPPARWAGDRWIEDDDYERGDWEW